MRKLKPCPFCRGEAELCYMPALWGYALYVSCKGCDAKSPRNWQEKEPKLGDAEWKVAADQWNRRPGETAETCGKSYCEHYPEGLPVCAECREASTLSHDMACAKLAEAQAEIERLNKGIKIVQSAFKNYKNADAIIARTTLKKAQILSASCNSDAVDSERAANEMLTTEIERKDKVIEQLYNALEKVLYYTTQDYYREDEEHVRRANRAARVALAAERGE